VTSTGTERGRRLARTERHQLIVDAAVRVFERRGTIAVTYEEIADEAGISRALVYNYFADRGALLEAVCQRNAKVLDHDVAVALTTTRGRREALAASMRAHLAMARRQPVAYRQASGDPALGAPRWREQVMVDFLSGMLGDSNDAHVAAAGLLHAIRSMVTMSVDAPDEDHSVELITAFVAGALAGLERVGVPVTPTWTVPR
jgi:AcrR family transcriptional regulator